jgi:maleate cis-trans isomerase
MKGRGAQIAHDGGFGFEHDDVDQLFGKQQREAEPDRAAAADDHAGRQVARALGHGAALWRGLRFFKDNPGLRAMRVEYASRGLIGVLTPQANTTVEPEMTIMAPAGVAMINARMVSPHAELEARLVDYIDHLDAAIAQFANAPLDTIALATTGTSYIAGVAPEAEIVARVTKQFGAPLVTTGQAVVLALRTLGARTIGLVSPYPPSLTEKASGYWSQNGFAIGGLIQIGTKAGTFHPIYTITAADAEAATLRLADKNVDAIVLLGTGMPTLSSILRQPRVGDAVVLSCMMCLGWAAIDKVLQRQPTREALLAFAHGDEWGARLRAHMRIG